MNTENQKRTLLKRVESLLDHLSTTYIHQSIMWISVLTLGPISLLLFFLPDEFLYRFPTMAPGFLFLEPRAWGVFIGTSVFWALIVLIHNARGSEPPWRVLPPALLMSATMFAYAGFLAASSLLSDGNPLAPWGHILAAVVTFLAGWGADLSYRRMNADRG